MFTMDNKRLSIGHNMKIVSFILGIMVGFFVLVMPNYAKAALGIAMMVHGTVI